MSQTGDDCYFYYYSTCAKGDSCPFRHQPAALGCEVTCNLWEKGTCFKKACTFRHMVIEKDRSTIPCLWENRQSGCMKPYCPFLHTKPKNIPTSAGPPQSVVDPARDNATGQSIPTLSGNPRPTRPMHPPPAIGRAGPHMYNGPPPINMPHNQGPYMGGPQPMQQRPMRYQGFIPRSQPSHPMVYQMQHNNQLHMAPMTYAGVIPGVIPNMLLNNQRGGFHRNTGSDYDDSDDYTSSDFSDVSLSDDERKVKSKDSSHRRVQSPRHVKNKREVRQRSDRSKRTESRSTRDTHSDRKANRRKYEEKEKERSRKDSDRNRSKPRKHSDDKNSSSERKRSQSPTDKNKSDPDKAKSDPEESKDDIKVKTLEEILREKALKNLHERTAQKKKAQMEAEKARKEEGKEDNDSDSPEPILKSVVSVSKAESTSSQKEPLKSDDENDDDDDDDNEVQFVRETKAHFRSPKTIIRSIIDPDNESKSASTKTFRKIKEVEPAAAKTEKPRENKEEKGELKPLVDSTTKSTSDLTNIKIKTFEEIMEEKRQRKQQTSSIDQDIAVTTSESITQDKSTAVSTVIPAKTRKIRVVKKAAEDINKESKPATGKLVVRRKVETAPRKEVANKELPSQAVQDEKTKENKKIVEIDKPTNIVIKSFDEIMREKRQRQQEQSQSEQPQPSEVSTSTVAAKKPTIIRKKPLISKPEQKPAAARTFKSRKLKVVGRQGITKSKEADNSEPTSPSKPECLSPATNTQTIGEPSSHQDTIQPLNVEREGLCSTAQESSSQIYSSSVGADDDDSDDDDSWEHEELPAVPILTPTLEGPAAVHDVPDGSSKPATVFHIPAGRTTEANTTVAQCHVSPTKRSRSSLEELFGVPCDDPDSKLDMEVLPEEKEKEVSPAKKVKTSKEDEKDIIKELSKTDDFDLELEEEIANLSPDKHFDPHETLNEDDLLLELEEMIND